MPRNYLVLRERTIVRVHLTWCSYFIKFKFCRSTICRDTPQGFLAFYFSIYLQSLSTYCQDIGINGMWYYRDLVIHNCSNLCVKIQFCSLIYSLILKIVPPGFLGIEMHPIHLRYITLNMIPLNLTNFFLKHGEYSFLA